MYEKETRERKKEERIYGGLYRSCCYCVAENERVSFKKE